MCCLCSKMAVQGTALSNVKRLSELVGSCKCALEIVPLRSMQGVCQSSFCCQLRNVRGLVNSKYSRKMMAMSTGPM